MLESLLKEKSAPPADPPPAADYDKWLEQQYGTPVPRTYPSGHALRRMVILRRRGATNRECGQAVGLRDPVVVGRWLRKLPPELAP